ncbi:MAG: histidine kinase [Kaistia sp. SCN 65-12]|nr:MAG: histidine kinase [Kaistia sp. SCN 65-12]
MGRLRLVPNGFRGRLLLIFLLISTLPLVATGFAFFAILNANVEAQTFGKLGFVRDAKKSEIEQYLGFAERQAASLARSNAVRYAIGDFYGFSYAFRQIDGSPERATALLQQIFAVGDKTADHQQPVDDDQLLSQALEYANAHTQFHEDFVSFVRTSEFDNVYLVTPEGRVVYSMLKDRYLGRDLSLGFSGTLLSDLVDRSMRAAPGAPFEVSDFARDPITGVFGAYVAVRVEFYHKFRGTVVLRLPTTGLDRLTQAQNSETAQLYLLSAHHALVSAPVGAQAVIGIPTQAAAAAGAPRAAIVAAGLGGAPALSASAPVQFGDLAWSLVAEVPTALAFANADELKRVLIIVAAISLPLLVLVVVLLSRTMTAPIVRLTGVAEAIARGDLDRDMPAIASPRELSRLATSFRRMRDALRNQLSLVGQKNAELEQQVRVIAEKNSALELADRHKDTFLANTSHELRTPLNGIIGIAETLAGGVVGKLSAPQRSQLDLITFSARRLSRIVDDLLDLYRIRQGRMRLDIHPVHVATSVRNVLQVLEPMLRGEPVTLTVDIPDDLGFVLADPVRLEQILYNLIGNAIKYTDQGAIAISAEATPEGTVLMHVADSGRGISAGSLERIFQPLEQVDGFEAARQSGGTGLGLTIARQLAHMLDGEILAQSIEGQGSRFTLRLPRATPAAATDLLADPDLAGLHSAVDHALDAPMVLAQDGDDAAPQILVVDDEPINIQVLRNVLQPQGYIVRTADSGRAALEAVERHAPDLVILDVMMPDIGGLDVARQLRRSHSLLELPIIMITARSRTRDTLAGFENGANDYVVKPFVKEELLARIATLLEARRARGTARENLDLRQEIERRVLVEDALRLSQQRLARLLDALNAGLVCVAENGALTYANHAASTLVARRIEPGVTSLADIIPPATAATVIGLVRADGKAMLEAVPLDAGRPPVRLSAFELEADAGGGIACVLMADTGESFAQTEGLVRGLRAAIDTVGPALTSPAPLPAATSPLEDGDEYRRILVEVTSASLGLWRRVTGRSKIDFAEASGIWRASFDRSSLQVRTLDKYLLIETLPANPRWRDVVQTAEFVLGDTEAAAGDPAIAALRAELSERLAVLRTHLKLHLRRTPQADTAGLA